MYRDCSLGKKKKKKKSIKMGMFNRFCDFSMDFTLFVIVCLFWLRLQSQLCLHTTIVNDLVVALDVSQIYITAEHVIMMSSISEYN